MNHLLLKLSRKPLVLPFMCLLHGSAWASQEMREEAWEATLPTTQTEHSIYVSNNTNPPKKIFHMTDINSVTLEPIAEKLASYIIDNTDTNTTISTTVDEPSSHNYAQAPTPDWVETYLDRLIKKRLKQQFKPIDIQSDYASLNDVYQRHLYIDESMFATYYERNKEIVAPDLRQKLIDERFDPSAQGYTREQPRFNCQHSLHIMNMSAKTIQFCEKGLHGLMDNNSNVLLAPTYTNMMAFSHDLAAVYLDNKWGFINPQGQEVISRQYTHVKPFYLGVSVVEKDGTFGVINREGLSLFPWSTLPIIDANSDFAVVKHPNSYQVINRNGDVVLASTNQTKIEGFFSELNLALVTEEQDHGVDLSRLNTTFNQANKTLEKHGLTAERWDNHHDIINVSKDNKVGIIDRDGKWVVPLFQGVVRPFDHQQYIKLYDNQPNPSVEILNQQGRVLWHDQCEAFSIINSYVLLSNCVQNGTYLWGNGSMLQQFSQQSLIEVAQQNESSELVIHEYMPTDSATEKTPYYIAKKYLFTSDSPVYAIEAQPTPLASIPTPNIELFTVSPTSVENTNTLQRPKLYWAGLLVQPSLDGNEEVYTLMRNDGHQHTLPTDMQVNLNTSLYPQSLIVGMSTVSEYTNYRQLYGVLDIQGNTIVPMEFSKISDFEHGLAIASKEEKNEVYVITEQGELHMIPKGYNIEIKGNHTVTGYRSLKNHEEVFFVYHVPSKKFKTYPNIESIGSYFQGLLALKPLGKPWGFIDEKGDWVVEPQYTLQPELLGETIDNSVGWLVTIEPSHKYDTSLPRTGLLNTKGKVIIPPEPNQKIYLLSERFLIAEKLQDDTTVSALYDTKGNKLVDFLPGTYSLDGEDIKFDSHQKIGLYDVVSKKYLLEPYYANDEYFDYVDNHRNMIMAKVKGQRTYIDADRNISTPNKPHISQYDSASQWFSQFDSKQKKLHLLGSDFKPRLTLNYVNPYDLEDGDTVNNRWNLGEKIDARGDYISDIIFDKEGHIYPIEYDILKNIKGEAFDFAVIINDYSSNERGYGLYDIKQQKIIVPTQHHSISIKQDGILFGKDDSQYLYSSTGNLLYRTAWLCQITPVLVNAKNDIVWPKGLSTQCTP